MFFNIYKKKQGKIIRWCAFLVTSLIFLFGVYRLYYFLFNNFAWAKETWKVLPIPVLSVIVRISPSLIIGLVSAIIVLLLFYYLSFRSQRISDFLIDTESEMRKVSWPTFNEVIRSSIAVIVIISLMAVYLYLVDNVLNWVFKRIFF